MFQPDRQIHFSLTVALAWLAWTKVVVDFVIAVATGEVIWALCGCATSAVAATLQIRSFFSVFGARMRSCFELGREVEREAQRSRALHSI